MPLDMDRPSIEAGLSAVSAVTPRHVCSHCHAAFNSSRALSMHVRSKHKERTPLRFYLDGSGVCPVCRTAFDSPIRLLAHVSETRRRGKTTITCRARLMEGSFPLISNEECGRLDEIDRKLRKAARKAGRSHPLVSAPAVRSRIRATPELSHDDKKRRRQC